MKPITAIIDGEEFEVVRNDKIICNDCYFGDSCDDKSFGCPLDFYHVFKKK